MKIIPILFLITLIAWSGEWLSTPSLIVDEETPVARVLVELGDEPLAHQPDLSVGGASVEVGRDLVLKGIAKKPNGGKTTKQSNHFVCTSCHNVQKEDPDLSVSDPQARLEYVRDHGMPFLQGTTLYGAVNRTSFYNGDYEKKYGDLVKPARNNIREAIQLCAVECSQGRALASWEMESVLAYLWTLELKMKDLNIKDDELQKINMALQQGSMATDAIQLVKDKYLPGSPATFVTPPENRTKGYPLKGNAENGALIYDLSCKHCHEDKRYSFFELDDTNYSFQFLERHISRYTRYSVYQVARYGTSPIPGKMAYMPNYTLEKMSDQQMEDLRAYIDQMSK
ncbi:MAG: hypothetical protein DHS20C18_19980 [Saprospiraceae bacterium]|nr:MAG: hypothetical protein DHS20C18_19980 [Saprospiraceae bacterium]